MENIVICVRETLVRTVDVELTPQEYTLLTSHDNSSPVREARAELTENMLVVARRKMNNADMKTDCIQMWRAGHNQVLLNENAWD